jgi:peroxiredoxin
MEINREIAVRDWVDDRLATLKAPADWEPDTGAGIARFRRGREARTRTTRMCIWTGATAVATVAGLLALPGPRVFAQRCVDACLAETAIGTNLLHHHTAAAPSIRQPAPDFSLLDASGETVSLSSLRGQVVVLNFWATWCAPCKVEIPWFVALRQQYGGAGLSVVGVAMDDDGWQSVQPGIAALGINYPVVLSNDALAKEFGGVQALPTTLLIDKSGRVAVVHQGLVDLATVDAEIRNLIVE